MSLSHVTFAYDEENHGSNLKHTNVFFNRNIFQCYHNNRGYCSFGDKCRYQHFEEICGQTMCREKYCKKRHPVICRYQEHCKFFKMNTCAFKHTPILNKVKSEDFENKIELSNVEIKNLRREILDLKDCIKIKETELIKSKIEIERLNKMITMDPQDSQAEKDLTTENDDMKKEGKTLERENEVLKVKLNLLYSLI